MTGRHHEGVYVVALDLDITGPENVAWAFRDEGDADRVVAALEASYGEGRAWQTYEPVAGSVNDDDLAEYLAGRGVHVREGRFYVACSECGTEGTVDVECDERPRPTVCASCREQSDRPFVIPVTEALS